MTAFFHQIRSQLLEPTKKVWSEWIGVFFKTRRSKKSSNELHPPKEGTCFFPDFFEKKTNKTDFTLPVGTCRFIFGFFFGESGNFFLKENHLPRRKGQHETAEIFPETSALLGRDPSESPSTFTGWRAMPHRRVPKATTLGWFQRIFLPWICDSSMVGMTYFCILLASKLMM